MFDSSVTRWGQYFNPSSTCFRLIKPGKVVFIDGYSPSYADSTAEQTKYWFVLGCHLRIHVRCYSTALSTRVNSTRHLNVSDFHNTTNMKFIFTALFCAIVAISKAKYLPENGSGDNKFEDELEELLDQQLSPDKREMTRLVVIQASL